MFAAAAADAAAGFTTLHVLAHANVINGDLHAGALWRNVVPFDPGAAYGGVAANSTAWARDYLSSSAGLAAAAAAALVSSNRSDENGTRAAQSAAAIAVPPPPLHLAEDGRTWTYSDVLLQPAAAALADVLVSNVTLEFAVAGEQGLSVWRHPRSYIAAMRAARNMSASRCGGNDP